MATIAVYLIVDEKTGKFYVGSSSNFQRRQAEHKSELKARTHDNWRLQELYNAGCKLKFYHLQIPTVAEARKLEKDILTDPKNSDKLLNLMIPVKGGYLRDDPRRGSIIERIRSGRKRHWENLSDNDRRQRIARTIERTMTPEVIAKRTASFKKYWATLSPEEKKPSQATIDKRRLSSVGQKRSAETIEKMRQAQTGKKASDAARAKMSNSAKLRCLRLGPYKPSPQHIEKLRQINLGKRHTKETKQKIAQQKREWQASRNPEERKHSEETKRKISEKHKGKVLTMEHRLKLSEAKRRKRQTLNP